MPGCRHHARVSPSLTVSAARKEKYPRRSAERHIKRARGSPRHHARDVDRPARQERAAFYGCWLDMAESELGVLGSPRVRKVLGSSSKKAGPPVRHLKIGSVIVREHQGKVHEVLETAIGVSR